MSSSGLLYGQELADPALMLIGLNIVRPRVSNRANETPQQADVVVELVNAYTNPPTLEYISSSKAYGLSGGAVCLAVLLAATQLSAKGTAAYTAIYGAIVGMPIWLYYGGIHDYYLFLGEESYLHLASKEIQTHLGRVLLLAGLSLVVSLAALSEHLAPFGSVLFCSIALVVLVKLFYFHHGLANWWKNHKRKPSGPGA